MAENIALKAAQGMDLNDLLNHIAWTDVVKPELDDAKARLTKRLVDATLKPQQEGTETREQLAGMLYGIQFIELTFARILREGARSKEELAKMNLFIS